jgi:uncharacterized spore protein YtfJ
VRADDIMNRIGDGFGARRVFGQPVERDGVTVIPVAMVGGGGGGGGAAGGAEGTPGGAGFGGWSRGIGVFVLRDGDVRFVPATDRTLLVLVGLLVWGRVILRVLRGTGRRRKPA